MASNNINGSNFFQLSIPSGTKKPVCDFTNNVNIDIENNTEHIDEDCPSFSQEEYEEIQQNYSQFVEKNDEIQSKLLQKLNWIPETILEEKSKNFQEIDKNEDHSEILSYDEILEQGEIFGDYDEDFSFEE